MEYLDDTKLQVNINESTGDISGVCVERYWILVDCREGGYVPNVKPMRLANGWANVRLGHWGVVGKFHVAFVGFT
jgi:hypothetical protein